MTTIIGLTIIAMRIKKKTKLASIFRVNKKKTEGKWRDPPSYFRNKLHFSSQAQGGGLQTRGLCLGCIVRAVWVLFYRKPLDLGPIWLILKAIFRLNNNKKNLFRFCFCFCFLCLFCVWFENNFKFLKIVFFFLWKIFYY